MDNECVKEFLEELVTTTEVHPGKALIAHGLEGWIPTDCPDENGRMKWAWKKQDVKPESKFHIKMVHHYKGVTPDELFDCLTSTTRVEWDAQDIFEIIEEDKENLAHIIHQTFKKPPTHDQQGRELKGDLKQRDLVYKFFARKNFLWSEEHGNVHVFASKSLTHEKVPESAEYLRASRDLAGNYIEALPDGSGSRLTRIVICDLKGKIPPMMVHRAAKNLPVTIYETLNTFCQKKYVNK